MLHTCRHDANDDAGENAIVAGAVTMTVAKVADTNEIFILVSILSTAVLMNKY